AVEAICRTWSQGGRRMQRSFAPLLFLLLLGFAGHAAAQEFNKKFTVRYCPDDGSSLPASCTKTITIYNNTDATIYPVVQGTLEQGPGVGPNPKCTTHGDRWLQAAFW